MPGNAPTVKQLLALFESFDWAAWEEKLREPFTDVAEGTVRLAGREAAPQFGLDADAFKFDDPYVQAHFTRYVGGRITQLEKTTKQRLIGALRGAMTGGESAPAKLQETILATVRETYADFGAARALRIARTETGMLFNQGAIFAAKQGGFEKVDVVDGTDCAPCAEANGETWTLEEALARPLEHPNCLRAFYPATE